jgi:hypothetical protein
MGKELDKSSSEPETNYKKKRIQNTKADDIRNGDGFPDTPYMGRLLHHTECQLFISREIKIELRKQEWRLLGRVLKVYREIFDPWLISFADV